jgi:hypothetical protein
MPRHPPCALKNLTTKMLASTVQFSNNKPTPHPQRRHQHPPTPTTTRTSKPVYQQARQGRNTKHPHHQQPTAPQTGEPQTTQMRSLLFQDPTVYQRTPSHQPHAFPPNPRHPPPKEPATRRSCTNTRQAIQDPKSQRPPMSTTHRTNACESGL